MTLEWRSSLDPLENVVGATSVLGASEFSNLLIRTNADYGWAVSGTPIVDGQEDLQVFRGNRDTLVAGSWVQRGDTWLFSMAWPQELGVPNYLTMSNFGNAVDGVGVVAENVRLYPITIMPTTQRKPR